MKLVYGLSHQRGFCSSVKGRGLKFRWVGKFWFFLRSEQNVQHLCQYAVIVL